MKSKAAFFVVLGILATQARDANSQTLESRITSLEKQLSTIEAQLGKLDFIAEHLDKVRNEDLPKLQRDVRGAVETAVSETEAAQPGASDLADPSLSNEAFDPAAEAEPKEGAVDDLVPIEANPPLPGNAEDAFGDLFSKPAATEEPRTPAVEIDDPLVARVSTIEDTAAKIEEHLKKLDDIAENLDLLRGEDLVKLQRDIRGLQETSAKLPAETGGEAETVDSSDEGIVLINNWTGVSHVVSINGRTYRVQPGPTKVRTKYGKITTQLPQYGSPREWDMSYWQTLGNEHQITLNLKN